MRKLQTLLFMTLLVAASACKKDSSNEPDIDPKVRQLARSWKTTAWTVNPPIPQQTGSPISDIYAAIGAASQDDIYTFSLDKTYTIEEGAISSPGSGKVVAKGGWFLSKDKNTLVLEDNPLFFDNPQRGLANWDILELTETTLKVTYPLIDTDQDGRIIATYNLTRTFTAQ